MIRFYLFRSYCNHIISYKIKLLTFNIGSCFYLSNVQFMFFVFNLFFTYLY